MACKILLKRSLNPEKKQVLTAKSKGIYLRSEVYDII